MEAVPVRDPTDVANARRRIVGLSTRMGYNETQAGRVAIVVTELAQNLLRHAGGGEMLAGADLHFPNGIEIMALDRGPGMADVAACLRDGYSTGGTSGNGLGAIKRLAHEVLIHSVPGGGTVVLVRMGQEIEPASAQPGAVRDMDPPAVRDLDPAAVRDLDPAAVRRVDPAAVRGLDPAAVRGMDPGAVRGMDPAAVRGMDPGAVRGIDPGAVRGLDPGAVRAAQPRIARGIAPGASRATATLCVPKSGETVCGDTAAIVSRGDGTIGVLLADGLGHGPQAAAASQEAARLFQTHKQASPKAALAALHAGLRATRGAAVATASIDPAARRVTYGGIGNIAGFITDTGGTRRMVSHSGTAGHTAGRIQEFHYPLHHRPVVVMFSDGLASSWSPESHPGLFALDPSLIAGVLYRDHARGRDDASVVVWKG
jgi:anti-sigma regulatory factor (Ser/Thr protein kinase)